MNITANLPKAKQENPKSFTQVGSLRVKLDAEDAAAMRCAIYARFSSDLQRPTSIDDQVRRCRDFATKQGWTVVEEFIRTMKRGLRLL